YPAASRIAVLFNPDNRMDALLIRAMELTAKSLKLELQPYEVRRTNEIERVISTTAEKRADALAVTDDSVMNANHERIVELANSNRLCVIGPPELARAGGLIGYGVNVADLWYRGAFFVDKILKGAKPADLPVEQPTKFELVINLKTAKAIGLD